MDSYGYVEVMSAIRIIVKAYNYDCVGGDSIMVTITMTLLIYNMAMNITMIVTTTKKQQHQQQ